MALYIAVTPDKYELPRAVADSPTELARMLGVTSGHILSSISMSKRDGKRRGYVKVETEDEELQRQQERENNDKRN